MITVHVPAMTARADARVISSRISDVPGVRTLQADLATRTVRVSGSADPDAVTAAVTAAGYAVEIADVLEYPVGVLTSSWNRIE